MGEKGAFQMKSIKILALALSSVLAFSLFAGCSGGSDPTGDDPDKNTEGGNTEGEGGNPEGEGGNTEGEGGNPEGETPSIPEADKVVAPFSDQDATLALDGTTNANYKISDSLFGVFLEDINYAGYLLDDNLVVNGSFETFASDKTSGWSAVNATLGVQTSGGVLSSQGDYASHGVNAHYASVSVGAAGGGLSTTGHTVLPIAVTDGTEYLFSAFVKSEQAATMTVRIKDGSKIYAEQEIALKESGEWVKYQSTLTASGEADAGLTFEIVFGAAGVYGIDGIQLETKDSTGGIKQYVYDAIKELSPKFIRFPGGCIIEGDGGLGADTQEVYDWKNSVGAVQNGVNAGDDTIPAITYTLVKDGVESEVTTQGEWITRKQNADLWGYDMEYGVGFYEYFLLCDSLGASAIPVLNCGYSCMGGAASNPQFLNGRHNKKVDDYIQDAVNLIEFARGDKTTKWGALRAALGHEEPFAMDYIGIGNEQSGDNYYKECYEKFLQNADFKKALADYNIKPIVGNGMFSTNCQNTTKNAAGTDLIEKGTAQRAAEAAVKSGVVEKVSDYGVHDQHYYVNWTKLLENVGMYEDYTPLYRKNGDGYEVFVGEYSANDGEAAVTGYPLYPNSLITALSEAAMMTSYERHGNIIKLAAYAPMFGAANRSPNATTGGNNGVNQWAVDMMYYTNKTIVRTANYYVQQMFMQNTGADYLYKTKLNWTSESTFEFPGEPTGSKTFEKIYFVASKAADGDLIVKVVNVSGAPVKINIDITEATSKGFANVTELYSDNYKTLNKLNDETLKPVSSTIAWAGQSLGYEFKPYSLTVLKISAD